MYRGDGALSEETSDEAECPLTVSQVYNPPLPISQINDAELYGPQNTPLFANDTTLPSLSWL